MCALFSPEMLRAGAGFKRSTPVINSVNVDVGDLWNPSQPALWTAVIVPARLGHRKMLWHATAASSERWEGQALRCFTHTVRPGSDLLAARPEVVKGDPRGRRKLA